MRTAMLTLLTIVLVGFSARADEKPITVDKEKLVGKWEAVKGELPPGSLLEITKDGKLTLTITVKEKDKEKKLVMTGTYTLKGNVVHVSLKDGEKEHTDDNTIKELTDEKLVSVDDTGKKDEFKRVK
jgi:uncharacterized protein (TIGR03066 family)